MREADELIGDIERSLGLEDPLDEWLPEQAPTHTLRNRARFAFHRIYKLVEQAEKEQQQATSEEVIEAYLSYREDFRTRLPQTPSQWDFSLTHVLAEGKRQLLHHQEVEDFGPVYQLTRRACQLIHEALQPRRPPEHEGFPNRWNP